MRVTSFSFFKISLGVSTRTLVCLDEQNFSASNIGYRKSNKWQNCFIFVVKTESNLDSFVTKTDNSRLKIDRRSSKFNSLLFKIGVLFKFSTDIFIFHLGPVFRWQITVQFCVYFNLCKGQNELLTFVVLI